jgi:hypothetical protein
MDSNLLWAVIFVVVIVAVLAVAFYRLRPLFVVLKAVIIAAWRFRSDLDPRRSAGRWRLLGFAFGILAVLLLLQGRGYPLLGTILAWVNIDIGPTDAPAVIFSLIFALLPLGYLAGLCFARAKRFDAQPAAKLLSEDTRPAVVYLRSFDADSRAGRRIGIAGFSVNTEEGEIAEMVSGIGPLIAIGRPGETLSYFGAARLYAGEDDWHETVRTLLAQAPLVMVLAGKTPGLWWEIEACVKTVNPERLVFLIPLNRSEYDEFRRKAAEYLPCSLPEYQGRKLPITSIRAVLFFDSDWTPHLLPLQEKVSVYWRKALVTGLKRTFIVSTRDFAIFKERSEMRRVLENTLQPVLQRSVGA